MADVDDGPAISKRVKINKVRQEMSLIVLVTSVAFGVCLVFAIYFIKNINFNAKVIDAKDSAILDYEKTITNVGVCQDLDKDGKYSIKELKKCNPNELSGEDVPGSLRYNVMVAMAENQDLESVARESQDDCFNQYGNRINFQKRYDNATTDEDRELNLAMLKMCSALRVVSDALPAQKNEEALMSSLNQIFILSNWEPESLSPSGDTVSNSELKGVQIIPVNLSVETNIRTTLKVLTNIERSIRGFDMQTASISWSGRDRLSLQAQAQAFYTQNADIVETTKTVYASDKKKAKGAAEK